jgi:predicted transcriptional regulator
MSQELRSKILILLDEHSRTGSAQNFEDIRLSEVTGAEIQEVRRQMDVLESEGLIKSANSFGGHSARIAPRGVLAVEQLRATAKPSGRGIGFKSDSAQ